MKHIMMLSIVLLSLCACGEHSAKKSASAAAPTAPLSSHLQFTKLTLGGSTDGDATVTVNNLADQDAAATLWSREQDVSNAELSAGFESSVEATDSDGSSERIITVTLTP